MVSCSEAGKALQACRKTRAGGRPKKNKETTQAPKSKKKKSKKSATPAPARRSGRAPKPRQFLRDEQ